MIIGLTGGIGSGKTTVAKMFHKLGVPVYVADIEAKKLMVSNKEVIDKIKALLGEEAYLNDTLNRAYISDKVFSNKPLLEQLNAIVHPAVRKNFENWVQLQNAPYVIKEAAILFESGSYKECDLIITVTAPLEERLKRVVVRDSVNEEEVKSRMENQLNDEEKIKMSDYVIHNTDLDKTEQQVAKINSLILNKIRKKSSF